MGRPFKFKFFTMKQKKNLNRLPSNAYRIGFITAPGFYFLKCFLDGVQLSIINGLKKVCFIKICLFLLYLDTQKLIKRNILDGDWGQFKSGALFKPIR